MATESDKYREKGNEYYRTARMAPSPGFQTDALADAINNYIYAYKTATSNDQKASACKNLGMSYWMKAKAMIAKNAAERHITPCFDNALDNFQDAVKFGVGRGVAWMEGVKDCAKSCWNDINECASKMDCDDGSKMLGKLMQRATDDVTKVQENYRLANLYFNWAVIALGCKDFKKSLHLLAECNFPLHEARKLGKGDEAFLLQCQELDDDVFKYHCCAQSIQARLRGEELLDQVVRNDEILNIDMVWEIVDWFKQAAILTRGTNVELEAIALSSLGKVYDKVLFMKDRAKTCLMKCVELANTVGTSTLFVLDEWYQFARGAVESYQKEQQMTADERENKKKEEIKEQIKETLDELKKNYDELKQEKYKFLEYIYKTHPPKNPEFKLGEIVGDNPEWATLKKLFQEAVIHYHPDKIDEKIHGDKWKVLSEEICKLLSSHYEFFKETDKPTETEEKEEKTSSPEEPGVLEGPKT